jgi:FkbM family methyltransferase
MRAVFYDEWDSSFLPEIFKYVYTNNVFQPYFYGKHDLTIVDVGAGVGIASNFFSQHGKVYAFEPCLKTFECLKKMIDFNKLDIVAQRIAISDKSGQEKLFHSNNSTANSLLEAVSNGTNEIVDCRTLSEVLEPINHVDFLWLETEGKEFDILGSETFDKVAPKIDTIMGSISSWNGRNAGQIKQSLQNRGFKIKTINNEFFYAER